MSSSGSDPELDAFLDRVSAVSAAVSGIADGSLSPDSGHVTALLTANSRGGDATGFDSCTAPQPSNNSQGAVRSTDRATPASATFRSGKGYAEDYEQFCRACHLEYLQHVERCVRCGSSEQLISQFARKSELDEKVRALMAEKEARQRRRERFQAWQAKKKKSSSHVTRDISAWDFWEPESDDEQAVLPPDHPSFHALERDLQARNAARRTRELQAAEEKKKGNAACSQRQYESAVQHYSSAIDLIRGDKTFYCNRAAAYLQLHKFAEALKDCTTALEIWEYFDSSEAERQQLQRGDADVITDHPPYASRRRRPVDPLVVKAYVRRTAALRGLHRWEEAMDSAVTARRLRGADDKECAQLVDEVKAAMEEEHRKEKANLLVAQYSAANISPSSSSSSSSFSSSSSSSSSSLATFSSPSSSSHGPSSLLDQFPEQKPQAEQQATVVGVAPRATETAPAPPPPLDACAAAEAKEAADLVRLAQLLTEARNWLRATETETDLSVPAPVSALGPILAPLPALLSASESARVYLREIGGLPTLLRLLERLYSSSSSSYSSSSCQG